MRINLKISILIAFSLAVCLFCGCNKNVVETIPTSETTLITTTKVDKPLPTIVSTQQTKESNIDTDKRVTPPPSEDNKSPMFLRVNNKVTLIKGDEFDLNKHISYIDNYDRNPKLTQVGNVDTSTPGTYEIKAKLEDYAGNTRTADIKVVVLAEKPVATEPTGTTEFVPTPTPKVINYGDFVNKYADGKVMLGIDVSKWQGLIDFEKVKNAGCEFVMIRSGVYFDGDFHADQYFYENFENAKKAGLKVGVYMYTVDNDEKLLRQHVDSLVNDILKGEKLDFPVAFDWESWNHFQQYNMSMMDINDLFYAFCDELEKLGYEGMLYSSKSKLLEIWEPDGHKVWLAHYTEKTTYEGDYVMWQVDEIGRIDGVDGNVDINIYYGG